MAITSSAVFALATVACAETCTLELKRVDPQNPQDSDYVYRVTNPQRIFVQIGKDGEPIGNPEPAAAFKRIVKKEPAYQSKHPFRAVVHLGSQQYAFALDVVPAAAKEAKEGDKKKGAEKTKKEEKPKAEKKSASAPTTFNRLFFDLNHNGDLTDDKPLEARPQRGPQVWGVGFEFPRLDVVLDDAGAKRDYSLFLEGQRFGGARSFSYVIISMNPAAYREGHVMLDGKKRHVFLLDYNSNGRFNDEMNVPNGVYVSDGRIPVQPGDMLLVDPRAVNGNLVYQDSVTGNGSMHYVSKLTNIDGRFYDVKISPAGDRLTLTPSTLPLGKVHNPNGKFRATIYGEQGFVDVRGDGDAAVPVPVGQWKLLSYTIDATPVKKAKKSEEKKPEEKAEAKEKKDSALAALARDLGALLGGSSDPGSVLRPSTVSAKATGSYKPIEVVKGETVELPFGPPYKPVVTADGFQDGQKHEVLSLGLSLVGSGGEICDDMTVKGGRPSKPKFTITDAKGKVIQEGRFEYG